MQRADRRGTADADQHIEQADRVAAAGDECDVALRRRDTPPARTASSTEPSIAKGSQTAIIASLSDPPSAIHLHPTAPLAPRVLLPGDPGRALALAQDLLTEPRMFNHNRGPLGLHGARRRRRAADIQSTGMGGPSAAIVLEELIVLGLKRAIRVGTAGAFDARSASATS